MKLINFDVEIYTNNNFADIGKDVDTLYKELHDVASKYGFAKLVVHVHDGRWTQEPYDALVDSEKISN